MKLLMTGASGFIGRELGLELVRQGHEIWVVSRQKETALGLPFPAQVIVGDLTQGPLSDGSLAQIEGVVHLMGESVAAGRWSESQKNKIMDSRVVGTKNLIASFPSQSSSLRVFVSASAVGFYGDRGDEVMTEDSKAGSDFLSDVCVQWENSVFSITQSQPEVRVCALRLGVVLSAFGGALLKMLTPFRLGLGGSMGSGAQWMSWIHLQDVVQIFATAVKDERFRGVINATAPELVTNAEFSKQLAAALGKSTGPAVPAFGLKAALGEMSYVVLASQRVQPALLEKWGFHFHYPRLKNALAEVASFFVNGEMIFRARQYLPLKADQVFPFFADAKNLEEITPPLLNFKIQKVSTPEIGEGTLIDYRLKIHGVPVSWRTRIEEWTPSQRFVDTQLKGPYTKWHHTHTFEPLAGGTLMTDLVRYKVPLSWPGWLASGWMVSKDVEEIFSYRQKVCAERFGAGSHQKLPNGQS
ncbi:MAG: TIGR01777 family oxidoreductase [Bdellovibrio sp.]